MELYLLLCEAWQVGSKGPILDFKLWPGHHMWHASSCCFVLLPQEVSNAVHVDLCSSSSSGKKLETAVLQHTELQVLFCRSGISMREA